MFNLLIDRGMDYFSVTEARDALLESGVMFPSKEEARKNVYEGELAITLGEVEEYQSLLSRFPSSKTDLLPLYDAAKERSAKLLGKVNALNNYVHIAKDKAKKKC